MLDDVLHDPTDKVWRVTDAREERVRFLNNFLTMSESILNSGDGDARIVAIRELTSMALMEFAGNHHLSSYAKTVFELCVAFDEEEH